MTIDAIEPFCKRLQSGRWHVSDIGIGVVGAGYMGKAHAVAMSAVGAVFDTELRPRLEMICTTSAQGAAEKARAFGFARSTDNWRELVDSPQVQAVVIASPQSTHREIALAALARGKPVLCEKPLGESVADSRAMVQAAEQSRVANMVGFNYIRTPASQLARQIISSGEIGAITYFRGEHTEDFLADPAAPANWRTRGRATGNLGDLAPHPLNAAMALMGPIAELIAEVETVHKTRIGESGPEPVTNDDHAQITCRFESGVLGAIYSSRIATGRKMGYAYEVFGTKGSIRFDQEDQNSLWLYKGDAERARQGFTRILLGPDHPDFRAFCLGAGHGTGYQDQIIIEARDFLEAIATGRPVWPTFRDGLLVNQAVAAAWASSEQRRWVRLDEV